MWIMEQRYFLDMAIRTDLLSLGAEEIMSVTAQVSLKKCK
jgi:hypothetical protein